MNYARTRQLIRRYHEQRRFALGAPRAAPGRFPYRNHLSLAEVAAAEDAIHENAGVQSPAGVRGEAVALATGESLAPTQSQAKAGDEATGTQARANVVEPVSRAAAGRSAAATSEPMDATAGETAPILPPAEMPAQAKPPARAGRHEPAIEVGAGGSGSPPAPICAPLQLPTAAIGGARICLDQAPSGMEAAVTSWQGQAAEPLPVVQVDDGKCWCGRCDARVPVWFGEGCIAGSCPLRVVA